jgi:hypothetical protein
VDGIPLDIFFQKWGPAGLLSVVVLLIFFGRLVPLRFHRDVIKQRDEWRKTAEEALRQNTVLLETAHTANATFKALKSVATEEPEAHESAR